ncbi:MAG: UbiA family prenyltransferase [Candidatus Nealsonbacteria bacterium]|nr:UbiA family prenyltransferase [Candidatus Nealsonbacteria bacterium]
MVERTSARRPRPPWFAYLELVRLPNVFTAMADVVMGYLFVRGIPDSDDRWTLGLLIAASGLLYAAGVVLNDVFDLAADTRLRPERPLPSGRISPQTAARLGWGLLILGMAAACLAGGTSGMLRPGIVALILAACIVGYNAFLKRTPLGPPTMGSCRMLNVLLGMSVAAGSWQDEHWLVAGAIGTYIAGVTWFARGEAGRSSRVQLAAATGVMMLGIAMLARLPGVSEDVLWPIRQQPDRWELFMVLLGALIGWRCLRAILDPIPARVQMAVKHAILSIIILDAAACYAVRDVYGALAVLVLLVPTMYFGTWIRST